MQGRQSGEGTADGAPVRDLAAPDAGRESFERLCDDWGLRYKGRPLRSVDYCRIASRVPLEPSLFDVALVRGYIDLQLGVYKSSARVRAWMDEESTDWGARLNRAAPSVPGPHVLWCRGDEMLDPSGSLLWAEQEIDDGSLGAGTALESAFLGTTEMVDSYAATLLLRGFGASFARVGVVTSASYAPYVAQFRYFAACVGRRHGIPVEVIEETSPDFVEATSRLIAEGGLVHNFFESHRSDAFFHPHWVPLFEAWMAGRARIWPAPATLYEWKGWPVVLHQPSLLEQEARHVVERSPHLAALRARLPGSVFLTPDHAASLRADRSQVLLKPAFGGGSYGVWAGPELWRRTLDRLFVGLRPHQFILQDLVPTRRVGGLHSKLSPHYFFDVPERPITVHVMLRPSRVVHGQADTLFAVHVVLPQDGAATSAGG